MAHDLTKSLLDFIQRYIPTLQAAEVLLFFAARPDGSFAPDEVAAAVRPRMAVSAVTEHVAQFMEAGVIAERPGGFAYRPASPALDRIVSDLRHAYDERPVTLIATIYRIADGNSQSC